MVDRNISLPLHFSVLLMMSKLAVHNVYYEYMMGDLRLKEFNEEPACIM